MSTVTTAAPIAVGDIVRRKDQRQAHAIGSVKEIADAYKAQPTMARVRWKPEDDMSARGLAGITESWVSVAALIRVGGPREAVTG